MERDYTEYRASVVDGLRRQGWERIDAENEADDRVERLRRRDRSIDNWRKTNG